MTQSDVGGLEKDIQKCLKRLSREARSTLAFRAALRSQAGAFCLVPPTIATRVAGPIAWSLLVACSGGIQRSRELQPIIQILSEGALINETMGLTLGIRNLPELEEIGELAKASLVGSAGNALSSATMAAQTAGNGSTMDDAFAAISSGALALQASALAMLPKSAEDDPASVKRSIDAGTSLQREALEAARTDTYELLPSTGFPWSRKGAGKTPIEVMRSDLWPSRVPDTIESAHDHFMAMLDAGGLSCIASWYKIQSDGWPKQESRELAWLRLSEAAWAEEPKNLDALMRQCLS